MQCVCVVQAALSYDRALCGDPSPHCTSQRTTPSFRFTDDLRNHTLSHTVLEPPRSLDLGPISYLSAFKSRHTRWVAVAGVSGSNDARWGIIHPHLRQEVRLKPPCKINPANTIEAQENRRHKPSRKKRSPEIISPPQPRTLRLSEISISVDEDQLRQYLNSLECKTRSATENVLALSLAPYIDWLVATVTFHQEPLIFTQCRPHHNMHIQLPSQLVGPRENGTITVDCDFCGITPLYHPPGPQEPTFE